MTISPFALSGSLEKAVSNLARNETVQFFTTTSWLNEDGSHWHIPVHAWAYKPQDSHIRKNIIAQVLEKKYALVTTELTEANFTRRINLLIADNKRGKQLIISLAGKFYRLRKTNARGQSLTILKIPTADIDKNATLINFLVSLPVSDTRSFSGKSLLIPTNGISIISDIDDTAKVSEVGNHAKLFSNTFYKDFSAIPGLAALYQKLASQGASLHFVSSSPWQLYPVLDDFFDRFGFPQRSISLKTVRFRDSSFFNLFKKGDKTKPKQIAPLIENYPLRKFILVGDSGEQDADVYQAMIKAYPERILAAYIRKVGSDDLADTQTEGGDDKVKLIYFKDYTEVVESLRSQHILIP